MTAATSIPSSRRRQGGLGLVNLIIAAIVVAIVVIVLMPAIPGFIEYRAIVGAVKKSAQDGSGTPEGIRRAFDRYAAIDDITSIRGSDLIIERSPDGPVVSFAYQKRIPLAGPASLVFDYAGSSNNR
jgi:hypothetical protein